MLSNQTQPNTTSLLHPATHMGPVTLVVSDLNQSINFYTSVLGLTSLDETPGTATMGAGTTPLLYLQALPGARRQPNFSTGLYHVAILLPSRPELGKVLLNLARTRYPVQGFGDHLVSEAIYLADPDGNGLELYRDRPREEWQWNGDQIVMATEALDTDGIMASAPDPDAPFTHIHPDTVIGHVHLRVGDIAKAQVFYTQVIGFDVVANLPSALFVSAGGYHHHLGMNTWQSRGAPQPPADSAGLREYVIFVPNADSRDQLTGRLQAANIAQKRHDNDVLVDDPWNNHIRIVPETV